MERQLILPKLPFFYKRFCNFMTKKKKLYVGIVIAGMEISCFPEAGKEGWL